MSRDEIIQLLKANIEKTLEITSVDGIEQCLKVLNVDDEGFVNSVDGGLFWMAFDDIVHIQFKS